MAERTSPIIGYTTESGEELTLEQFRERVSAHQPGPARVRCLCACGFEAWGYSAAECHEALFLHHTAAVGYPLTARLAAVADG